MIRCECCGAQIINATCHCGVAGMMREATHADAKDAVAAWEEANPDEVRMIAESANLE